MKIVIFDIWADYAHFRVPYTTSSPLTFPVPPKTALYGIIGAILGYDKSEYLEKFQNPKWYFAVGVKNKIVKTYIPENFINTKEAKLFARMPKGKSCRTQVNLEFVKNPKYRIYVASDSKDLDKLECRLKKHKSDYTVSLGLTECLANFKYIGTFEGIIINKKEKIEIASILPMDIIKESSQIDFFEEGKKFLKIRMPVEMNIDRELLSVKDFLIEANGYPITITMKDFIKINYKNKNIVMF